MAVEGSTPGHQTYEIFIMRFWMLDHRKKRDSFSVFYIFKENTNVSQCCRRPQNTVKVTAVGNVSADLDNYGLIPIQFCFSFYPIETYRGFYCRLSAGREYSINHSGLIKLAPISAFRVVYFTVWNVPPHPPPPFFIMGYTVLMSCLGNLLLRCLPSGS